MESTERLKLYEQMTKSELVFMNSLLNERAKELFLEFIKQTREQTK